MVGNRCDAGRITKCQFQRYLDSLGFPEGVRPVGRNSARAVYGQWLRQKDQALFDQGYKVWEAAEVIKRGVNR